jgi:IstB-like ATP binding protein
MDGLPNGGQRRYGYRHVVGENRLGWFRRRHWSSVAACEAGRRVRYATTVALVNELVEAAGERILSRTVARYGRYVLLCLDELGYLHLDSRGAELLFQVLTEREEKASIAVAPTHLLGVGSDLHRPPAGRRDCGSAHLQRADRGDRQRVLSAARDPFPQERSASSQLSHHPTAANQRHNRVGPLLVDIPTPSRSGCSR